MVQDSIIQLVAWQFGSRLRFSMLGLWLTVPSPLAVVSCDFVKVTPSTKTLSYCKFYDFGVFLPLHTPHHNIIDIIYRQIEDVIESLGKTGPSRHEDLESHVKI